jgi:ParB family chromosome partitioning protein
MPDPGPLALAERPEPASPRAPIAGVAGEAAAAAALEEVAGALRAAREEGRLVEALPLEAVEAEHLVRDRLPADDAETAALVASIRAHGQRTPIEVTALGGGRHGLISGWRRLAALRALHAETGEARFATVRALVRPPEGAASAYVAMVEENEIRAGISHYERARVVARSVEAGVFADEDAALAALFGAGSPSRRSKIKAFLPLYRSLGDHLVHPAAIPERLGLALALALRADPSLGARLSERLGGASGAEEELALLREAASARTAPTRRGRPRRAAPEIRPGLRLERRRAGLVLSGPAADAALARRLEAWLRAEG